MKKIIKYSLIGFISLIIVIGTLSVSKTVHNKEGMKAMEFGYPILFITQDLTSKDPSFPWKYSFSSPWEHPFKISWGNFLLSYLIIFSITTLVFIGVGKISVNNRKSDIT